MYQYQGRATNLEKRNKAVVDMFNGFPKKCPTTGLRYDSRSVYEAVAAHFYLSIPQVERILQGKAAPKLPTRQAPQAVKIPTLF